MVWNLFPSKVILVLGKARNHRAPNLGCNKAESNHLGDLMFLKKPLQGLESWAGALLWWSCQSPVAHSCGLLNHLNSFWGGMFKLNAKFDANDCPTRTVILNVTTTQHTCSLNSIYSPHWLVQWGHHCSHMPIPIHSPWLPGYINVTQAILVILTMAEVFLGKPHRTS